MADIGLECVLLNRFFTSTIINRL